MLAGAVGMALFWALLTAPPRAHPLHTAFAEIECGPDGESVSIQVRVFTDDLAAAVSASADAVPPDSVLSRYARGTLALADRAGRPLRLYWRGAERSGDTVLLRLEAKLAGGLHHARILHSMLWERFPDQVNIVRAEYGGRTVTLLFTRGDAPKTLP
jgi:hypothetical protein